MRTRRMNLLTLRTAVAHMLLRCSAGAVVAAVLTACGGSTSMPTYDKTIADVTAVIQTEMAASNTTGLSIAIVDGQRVVWARGFGYADKEAGIAAEADTIYEIGSISKTFAATAVMRLAEQGRIDLDQPVSRYVAGFSINQRFADSGPITLRAVLTHHTGIPGDLFNGAFTENAPIDYETWLLQYLKNEYTAAPVGQVLAYSNSAMALLRPAIDAVAPGGFKSYANALFDTMGMSNTSYDLDDRIPRSKLSNAYEAGTKKPLLYGNIQTAGTIRSSVLDMAQYIKMIHAGGLATYGRVLSQASLDEMFRRQNADAPLDFDMGIGLAWFLATYAGGKVVNHEGATPWFHAMVYADPARQIGIVVLSNTSTTDVGAIASQALKSALQEKMGIVPPPRPVPAYSPPDTAWTPAQFAALAGTYVVGAGMGFATAKVDAVAGGLRMEGQPDIWIPRQNGYFSLPDAHADAQATQYKFATVAGRSVISALSGGQESLYGERYDQGTLPAAWVARQGAYTATNINPGGTLWPGTNDVRIVVGADGLLRVTDTLRGDIPIKPVSDTLAFVGGIGRNRGESVRVVTAGGVEQVELWGYRYRKTGP